jgi:dienelactone hydrolase
MKKVLIIILLSFFYNGTANADNSYEIKNFEEKNIVVLKFKVPDKKFPNKDYVLAQIHFPKILNTKFPLIIHQHGSTRDGVEFEAWGGKTDEWGRRLVDLSLDRGYAVAIIDAFYDRDLKPGDKLKFPRAVNIALKLGKILSDSEKIDKSKIFYTGFSYGAEQVLNLQGGWYSNQGVFKAVVAAEPGCNVKPAPALSNFSTLIIKGSKSHYYPIACRSYFEVIKKINKVEYALIPEADHYFSLNSKIGKGKAFNGCSDNIILIYPDGTWKHLDGTLTNQKEARQKCMTNEAGGSKTRERLDEAINMALSFFDKH